MFGTLGALSGGSPVPGFMDQYPLLRQALASHSVLSARTSANQSSPVVAELQRALSAAGYPTAVDGIYGNGTAQSVRNFQQANRLTADGAAGPQTLERLLSGFAAPPPSVQKAPSAAGPIASTGGGGGLPSAPFVPSGGGGGSADLVTYIGLGLGAALLIAAVVSMTKKSR